MRSKKMGLIALESIMILLAGIMAFPFYYLVVNTFKNGKDATFHPLSLPKQFTLVHYADALEKMHFLRSLSNNIIITVLAIVFIVIVCAMAAYPIARKNTGLNRFLKFYFLAGLLIPFQVTILPLYKIMQTFHLINKLYGVSILYVAGAICFTVFINQGFIKTIPTEIEESATIDGCSVWKRFWLIVFPLMMPITATIVVYNTMGIWNDFLVPLLFLQSNNKHTLVMEVYSNIGQFSTDWTSLLTMMVISLIPIFLFFIFLQRYIISGLTSGAVKG